MNLLYSIMSQFSLVYMINFETLRAPVGLTARVIFAICFSDG